MGHFLHNATPKSSISSASFSDGNAAVSLLYDQLGNRKYLTGTERNAFLIAASELSQKARTFCLVLAYSGCRISEALALTPRRFDFDAQIVIFETLKKRRRGVFRAVPLPADVLVELEKVHVLTDAQSHSDTADKPLWNFGRTMAWTHVKAAMMTAGITGARSSPKGLRHAFGVNAIQAGVPLNLVKKWLGHSKISTTAIYADAVGEEERSLAARLWSTF